MLRPDPWSPPPDATIVSDTVFFFAGQVYLETESSSYAQLEARARKPREPLAGMSFAIVQLQDCNVLSSYIHAIYRLLGVYGKLRAVGAATSSADEQHALVEEARGLIVDICNDHALAAQSFIQDVSLRESLTRQVEAECQELTEYIMAAKRFNLEINSRAKDRVISFGEKLSCLTMTALLQDEVRIYQPLLQSLYLSNHF